MHCGKDTLVVNEKPFDQKQIAKFFKDVLKGNVFGFAQVDIQLPVKLYDKFSKMKSLFVFNRYLIERNTPKEMNMYKEKTGSKTIKETKKLLGVMKAKKIILYTLIIRWSLEDGLRLTPVHQLVEYE